MEFPVMIQEEEELFRYDSQATPNGMLLLDVMQFAPWFKGY
jgi:hypothetical protein